MKTYLNKKRLKDALISNATLNQIDSFRNNYNSYQYASTSKNGRPSLPNSSIDSSLLHFAIINLSKDVAEFLIQKEKICNYSYCLRMCKYNLLKDVWDLIHELESKYGKFNMDITQLSKKMLITRIIDPQKAFDNKERLSYVIELIRTGFLDSDMVISISDELYNTEKWNGKFKMVTREILLNELGI